MTIDWFFRQAWRWASGMAEEPVPERLPDLPVLQQTEWSPEFERLMRNRLIMGAFRYGRFKSPGKGLHAHMESIIRRAAKYENDGNLEHLVDIANLALVEFAEGRHPKRHFHSQDDVIHARKVEG